MKIMRILGCQQFFYLKGGVEVSILNTGRLLEEKGYRVIFLKNEIFFQS